MLITAAQWHKYINELSMVDKTAAAKMKEFLDSRVFDFGDPDTIEQIVQYAYALSTKYGEAVAELACEMYDTTAEAQGANVPAAEPADTATYGETEKAIRGSLKQSPTGQLISSIVERLTKQASADTMLKNAKRDGASFAWVPSGDTCPFCLALAALGWQKAGKTTLNGKHADHIHAHCDCTYAVDFKGDLKINGYDPDDCLQQIRDTTGDQDLDNDSMIRMAGHNAKGTNDYDYLNVMRRQNYAANKDAINAQKRIAYAARNGNVLRITEVRASLVSEKVKSGEYSLKLSEQQYNKHIRGTMDYDRYQKSREEKNLFPQSVLTISMEEAQNIIETQSGTGIIKTRRDGTPTNIEWITCDHVIGEYMNKGVWIKTSKAAIHHGKRGSHLVPIKGANYD